VKVRLLRRVGQFIPAGIPATDGVQGGPAVSREQRRFRALSTSAPPHLAAGCRVRLLQIVDIALKPSRRPSTPSTAISCIDQLSRILIRFAFPGAAGIAASTIRPGGSRRHLLDRLRPAGGFRIRADPHVLEGGCRRQPSSAAGTGRHRHQHPGPGVSPHAREQGRRILAGCAEKLGEGELARIRVRLAALEQVVV